MNTSKALFSWRRILRPRHLQPIRLCYKSLPMTNCILEKCSNWIQGHQTHSDSSVLAVESTGSAADCTSESSFSKSKVLSDSKADAETGTGTGTAASHNVASNFKVSTRHDLALVFTCKVCETRSMKMCSRDSYEKGVVVVRCGGCDNLHLIADRLGWFGEPGSIEELLAARGDVVKKGPVDSLNLTLEDLAGKKL